ncbi:MAG TPA: hypothetical protein VGP06_16640 [Janthinobacterium sp.]|nr:hypothetical protein [Janthinobacterium sp.]
MGSIRALLLSALFLASPLAMAQVEYHGFHIDDHLLDSAQKADFSPAAVDSVIEQLHIVESVGLPPELLDFFKGTRILVDPALRGNPGYFSVRDGEGAVRIQPIVFPANKPILLHELLHAYHYAVLSMKNPAILKAYDAASRSGVYPAQFQKAHFLSNDREFFAVTGTIYLFGKIQQPPFNCAILSTSDPDYLAFLENTFGRHECH